MIVHPERARRTANIVALDPGIEWHEIYKRAMLWEFPSEARLGFQLAFYRPFAVPQMAAVLNTTGHFRRDTIRRAYDTGLIMHEIIYNGVDSERGRKMIRLMNALHDRPDIHQVDLSYILNSLIVVPTRFIEKTGWRSLTAAERVASWRFYSELGARMGIEQRPGSYGDAEQQFDDYEARDVAPSPEGAALTASVVDALRDRMPRPARRYTAYITSALIDEPQLCRALGLPAPSRGLVWVLNRCIAIRKLLERLSPPAEKPSFWPGRPAGVIYPRGYALDDLGPKGAAPKN